MSKLFDFRVEILAGALGWIDVTDDVRGDLSITRGRSGEGYRADPGKCGFRLDNRSGRYSTRNPASDLYGQIGRNTPVRVYAGPTGGVLVSRFYGEIPSWPPRWSLSGKDRYVDVDAAGLLRRLKQGDQPARSAMRRTLEAAAPLAYWPIEDGSDSSRVASVLSGDAPLAIGGPTPEFRDIQIWTESRGYSVRYGTAALADVASGSVLSAPTAAGVPAATATGWTVALAADVPTGSALSGDLVLLEVDTQGGTYVRWRMVITTTNRTQIIAYTASGAATTVVDDPSVFNSMVPHNLAVWQDGGTIRAGFRWSSVGGYEAVGAVAGTLRGVTRVTVNATAVTATSPLLVGHLAVWAGHDLNVVDFRDGPMMLALFGYSWTGIGTAGSGQNGEPATQRLRRIAAEEGVTVTGPATPVDSEQAAGVQPTASYPALLDETIAVDGGLLFEDRDQLAMRYQPRATLYNQATTAIAYVGQTTAPFDPVDDDDEVRNDVTVERPNGSSARAVLTTGPLAAVLPPAGVGIYTTSEKVNVNTDGQLPDQAGWRLHLGTVDEPRYPAITAQLAEPSWLAAPALRAQLLALDVGGVLEVTGPPAWVSGRVRTLVTGYSETIGEYTWSITFNGVPASPWDVAEADGAQRAPADGSTLGVALGASDTAAVIASTVENGPWTQNPANFPLPVRIAGEQVTVSAIGPVLAETFTRTVSGGWGSPDTGPAWVVAPTPSQFAVGSGEGLMGLNVTNTTFTAAVPGIGPDLDVVVRLRADAVAVGGFYQQVVRYRIGTDYVESVIRYKTTGQIDLLLQTQSTVLSAVGSVLPYGPGSPFRLRIQAFGSTVRHVLWPAAASEPAWSATTSSAPTGQGDSFALAAFREPANTQSGLAVAFDSVTFRTPQRATLSARGVGGGQRAWPVGTEVNVWQPAIAAL